MAELKPKDWVGDRRSYLLAWGLPSAALVIALALLDGQARTWIWAVALTWMGTACLANARRCGRRHCYLTGPFFLVMAAVGLLHGLGVLGLGPSGWLWLAVVLVVVGFGVLWLVPERLWGKFVTRP
jgi:hypothetical protein